MASPRESFPTLENGLQEGVVLRSVIEGEAAAAKNGQLAFAFKDFAGNAILPVVNAQGALYVDATAAGTDKRVYGTALPTLIGNAAAAAPSTVVSLPMTNSKSYTEINVQVSCRRDAFFQLVYNNGTTKVPLMSAITGPGQYTISFAELHFTQTAGATGTNTLDIIGYCFDKASDLFATISCVESL